MWTLGHAFLTSDTISGDGLDTPKEELNFVFKSITEATASGMSGVPAASASWDQVTNTASGPPLTTAPDPAAQSPADPAATAVLTLSNATGGTSVTLPIDSYQFGFHNTPSFGSGGTTSKATFDALDVTLPLSNGSPALLTALTSAAHYQQATLTLKDSSGQVITTYAWAFNLVFVTDDVVTGSAGAVPEESVSFAFGAGRAEVRPPEHRRHAGHPGDHGLEPGEQQRRLLGHPHHVRLDGRPGPVERRRGPADRRGRGTRPGRLVRRGRGAHRADADAAGGNAPALTAPIDLDSFKFGFHNPTTIGSITGGAGTGKATFDALSVTAAAGAASPLLFYVLATNAPYDTATLTRYDAAGHPVAVWVLGTVFAAGDNYSGSDPTQHTEETLNFQFVSITEVTNPNQVSWSLPTNSASGGPAGPDPSTLDPLTGLAPL